MSRNNERKKRTPYRELARAFAQEITTDESEQELITSFMTSLVRSADHVDRAIEAVEALISRISDPAVIESLHDHLSLHGSASSAIRPSTKEIVLTELRKHFEYQPPDNTTFLEDLDSLFTERHGFVRQITTDPTELAAIVILLSDLRLARGEVDALRMFIEPMEQISKDTFDKLLSVEDNNVDVFLFWTSVLKTIRNLDEYVADFSPERSEQIMVIRILIELYTATNMVDAYKNIMDFHLQIKDETRDKFWSRFRNKEERPEPSIRYKIPVTSNLAAAIFHSPAEESENYALDKLEMQDRIIQFAGNLSESDPVTFYFLGLFEFIIKNHEQSAVETLGAIFPYLADEKFFELFDTPEFRKMVNSSGFENGEIPILIDSLKLYYRMYHKFINQFIDGQITDQNTAIRTRRLLKALIGAQFDEAFTEAYNAAVDLFNSISGAEWQSIISKLTESESDIYNILLAANPKLPQVLPWIRGGIKLDPSGLNDPLKPPVA